MFGRYIWRRRPARDKTVKLGAIIQSNIKCKEEREGY